MLRRFLTAEEVPRWFGLSVVLIYFVGLMCVWQFAITATSQEASGQYRQSAAYSIKLFSERLILLHQSAAQQRSFPQTVPRLLREFTANVPARAARIVSGPDGTVVASAHGGEFERTDLEDAEPVKDALGLEVATLRSRPEVLPDVLMRFPLTHPAAEDIEFIQPPVSAALANLAVGTVEAGGQAERAAASLWSHPAYIEVILPGAPPSPSHWAARAKTLGVLLVVMGALFLVYRCLRQQLRGVSRIAHRLESHRDALEREISALRISDGLDGVTQTWNRLVDLTEGLLEAVRAQKANEELSRVLQRSGGGALAEALHAAPDALMHIVDETRVDYANSAACRLMGWKGPEDMKGKDGPGLTLADVKAGGVAAKIVDLLRSACHADGRFEPRMELFDTDDVGGRDASSYRVWLIPIPGGRRLGQCLVIARDVSQQIRAERAREEFIAQITHEFRTPLTNIRAYTETLSSGMFEDPQTVTECYNVITKETRRLSRLIEDILSVSQLEVGSIELRVDHVDVRQLLTEGVRDVRGLAEEKSIDLQLVLPAKLEPIRGDRDKLAVVVNNLLGNAIKYTRPGGTVIVGCQRSADAMVLTFKDNGLGISPADQRKVFEKFQRGSDPEVQSITGTGIGLYTAREIVRRHGGDIELISAKGAGSTFMVKLPHRESRGAALSTTSSGETRG